MSIKSINNSIKIFNSEGTEKSAVEWDVERLRLNKTSIFITEQFNESLNLISKPYDYKSNHNNFQTIPSGFDDCYKTFCGT